MAILKRMPIVATLGLLGLCISLACWTPSTPISATWTYQSGFDPHGGYVDRWMWVIGGSGYIPITQLLIGEVDGLAQHIIADYVTELEANPNIEVNIEPGVGFRILALNCAKFPTNITGYRRALAFALDKNLVCEEGEGGLTAPMDGVIPMSISRWTYEHQITEHFYYKDILSANASLEAAGFRDLDGDGWREYDTNNNSIWDAGIDIDDGGPTYIPSSPGCHIELLIPPNYQPSFAAVNVMKAGMTECGLRGSIQEYEWEVMLESYCFNGLFNLACFSLGCPPPGDPILLNDFFHSKETGNLFFFRFSNSEYDSQVEAMMMAPTYEEAKQWAWNCSKILLEDMPLIVCYNSIVTNAYRTDRWTGYVKMPGMGVMGSNPWTPTSVRLNEEAGGPFGCYPTTYRCSRIDDMYRTNAMTTRADSDLIVFNMLYDSLWEVDPITWDPSPLIARNWTIDETSASGDIQEGQKFTFHLFENITWHDGTPLTAADVAFSLEDLWANSFMFSRKVKNIYRIDTPDNFTVIMYSNVSGIFEFTKATSLFVLPKHIWEPHWDPVHNYSVWVPETQLDFTGSGPYKWGVHIPGEYIVLDRNNDWVFGVDRPVRPPCPLVPLPLGLMWFGIAGIVIAVVVIGIIFFRIRKK